MDFNANKLIPILNEIKQKDPEAYRELYNYIRYLETRNDKLIWSEIEQDRDYREYQKMVNALKGMDNES